METPIKATKRLAIIIAIEDYRNSTGIPSVQFAINDAAAFKNILIEHFNFEESEIIYWTNSDAVQNTLTNDLPYQLQQLSEEHQFIFYYAGHGFYENGSNKVTCWDTHHFNVSETAVSLQKVLFEPLQKSGCKQSLIFLDCCSSPLSDKLGTRDVISDMNVREFDTFIKTSRYDALFMSCSPGEKSSSSSTLRHGIWTYHLVNALSGKVQDCIIKEQFITSNSLQNYLSSAIPRFIKSEKMVYAKQTPYARIGAANEFLIREIILPEVEIDLSRPSLELDFAKALLRKVSVTPVKQAEGFTKNYSVPKFVSRVTQLFVQDVFYEETKDQVQKIYEQTKRVFGLKSGDIKYDCQKGGGRVECEYFNYYITVEQHSKDAGYAIIRQEIYPLVPLHTLPKDFDSIFPVGIDELIIPIVGDTDFDELVRKFETFKEMEGGDLKDNAIEGTIEYITKNHTSLIVDTKNQELIVTHYLLKRPMELIRLSLQDIQQLSQQHINLLE
jgi:hypothetical protein